MVARPDFRQDFLEAYSDEALLDELRRVAVAVPDRAMTMKMFDEYGRASASTVVHRFGGWAKALLLAGLSPRQLVKNGSRHYQSGWSWSEAQRTARMVAHKRRKAAIRESHIELLQTIARKLGKATLSMTEFDIAATGKTAQALQRFFGDWNSALVAAGLVTKKTCKQPFSREECFCNLKHVLEQTGSLPSYEELGKPPSYIGRRAYERLWGSYSAALREFTKWHRLQCDGNTSTPGLTPAMITRSLSTDELKDELRRVAGLCGGSVTQESIAVHSTISWPTFARRLGKGNWAKALESAGLTVTKMGRKYSEEEFFENLMLVWEKLGRRPSYSEMNQHTSRITANGYAKRFGSWRKALLAFLKWVELGLDGRVAEGTVPNNSDHGLAPSIGLAERMQPDGNRSSDGTLLNSKGAGPAQPIKLSRHPNGACKWTGDNRSPNLRQKFVILRRDKFHCVSCGRGLSEGAILQVDHIKAWSKGGKTIPENLQTLCDRCNLGKGDLEWIEQ